LSSNSDDISGMQSMTGKHVKPTLPIEDLIAGPISAIITAQSYSAHATCQYVLSLMDNSGSNVLSPKTLEIMTSSKVQVSENQDNNRNDDSADSGVIEKKQLLSIPLLSLLPVPYISINEAEIGFNVDIINYEARKDTINYKILKDGKKIPFFTAPSKIHAIFASSGKSTNNTKSHISIKIKLKQQELPRGLEKYLQILGNSITVK